MASSKNAPLKTSEVTIEMPMGQEGYMLDPCKELMNIFGYKAQAGTSTSSAGAKTRPKIQEVPQIMRENEKNKINYFPKLVSIGPYHYGNRKLKEGQALKTRLVQEFSSNVQSKKKSLEAYFHSMEFGKVVSEAKNCYAMIPKAVYTDEAFKCLMFLDGCFVVYFIHCVVNKCKDVQMKNHHKAIITMDLFLLENQLPYTVLQALVNEFMPPEKNKDIAEFIKKQTGARGIKGRETNLYGLLPKYFQRVIDYWRGDKKDNTVKHHHLPLHLLDYLRTEFLITASSPPSDQPEKNFGGEMEWRSFRPVEELKAAGIHCKTSGSSSVKEIKFKPYKLMYGSLSLPAIVIDDSFKTKWLNMLAYEACTDFINDGGITSFICFMDSLIDRPEDVIHVKELREKGILQKSLGSDEHVGHLFNELATDLTPNPYEYRQVKRDIEKHFNRTWAVWFAEGLHTHLMSIDKLKPWTVPAFVATLLILFLTVVQTYFAAFPKGKK
ncbi:UPF0481 protein At3g47200-like [Macadamia integrifolia]|uniref:UPF0481 protein At3g47200-like n=1 Tax=Macadamia integrifolia TaxID=60698 RepID=UPI001C527786|nr:UPF0481 protein At3g47200-like [Macadamia integrifolia]